MTDAAVSAPLAPGETLAPQRPSTPARPSKLAYGLGLAGRFLITTGIVILLFAAYQTWGTNFQEAAAQKDLEAELTTLFDAPLDLSTLSTAVVSTDAAPESTPAAPAPAEEIDPAVYELFFPEGGEAAARIEIPRIDVDKVVVRGVTVPDLRKGPGLYPTDVLPGTSGNAAIAGHRTTYGAPFNRIDELQPGDEIIVTTIQGPFTYRVLDARIAFAEHLDQVDAAGDAFVLVNPSATWVVDDFGDDRLTLTACHPKYSAKQRIIVAAELVSDVEEVPVAIASAFQETLLVNATPTADADPVETLDTAEPVDATATLIADDVLDQGLEGERDAIPGAIGWMIPAIALWVLGGWAARRYVSARLGRIGLRLLILVPVGVCLWFSFESIDRALPAY